MAKMAMFDSAQRAFIEADGTAENIAALDAILGSARLDLREVPIATLNIIKSFDTVSRKELVGIQ